MKKVLTEDDIIRQQYSDLIDLNQGLKNISEIYYLGYNNIIYMKSLVPFVEKVAILNDTSICSKYRGILYLPNKLFDFKKDAKKSKLVINQTENNLYLGQNDNDEISITLNRGFRDDGDRTQNENTFINTKIIPDLYRKYFSILGDLTVDSLKFTDFSDDTVNDIASSKMLEYDSGTNKLILTKHLFLDIKKGDRLSITKLPYSGTPNDSNFGKEYYMLRNSNELYTVYTMISCISGL